jgi:hypothetical protein
MNTPANNTTQEFKGAALRSEQALEALDKQIEFSNDVLAYLYAQLAIEQARNASVRICHGYRGC